MSEPVKKSLVQKLAEVMGEVERVAKSGRNDFHRYDYATEADIVASVRGGMAARGVMLIPSIEKIDWTERETKSGKVKIATITVRFTFLDGESDARIEFVGMGQGEDASDKAIYKAMTGAEKYALLKTFLIPTGDDPEKDAAPQQSRTNGTPQQPRANSAPAQPAQSRTDAVREKLKQQVVGETTLEKEAREKREAAAKAPKETESTMAMRAIAALQAQMGWTGQKIASVLKGATGKSDRSQVTLADVEKVKAAVEVLIAAESRAQAPPPH